MSHPDPTAEQIAAELADHLATSAGELERRGTPAAEATKQAHQQFGDVEAVSRQCYWVQQGDTIMFRRVTIALVVLLCLGLIATTANSWLAQSRMSQQLDKLNEQLASLTKTQESLQDQQKPLSITGLIYDGDKNKPVANAEVGIARLDDSGVVRRIKTNVRGIFDSGPLAPGDYYVFAAMAGNANLSRGYLQFVQGPPQYVYAGVGAVTADLDSGYRPSGKITLECSPALKSIDVDNRYRIVPSLMVTAFSGRWKTFPWNPNRPQLPHWPLYVSILQEEGQRVNRGEADRNLRPMVQELLTVEELSNLERTLLRDEGCFFPEGNLYIGGLLVADVVPANEQPVAATGELNQVNRHEELRLRLGRALAEKWIVSMADVKGRPVENVNPEFAPVTHALRMGVDTFTIASGEELRLRVELPRDWDGEIRAAVDSAKSVDELLIKLNQGRKLFLPVKLSRVDPK